MSPYFWTWLVFVSLLTISNCFKRDSSLRSTCKMSIIIIIPDMIRMLDVPKEKQTDQHVKVCKKGQHWWIKILLLTGWWWGARDGAVVRALASPTNVAWVHIPASTPYVGWVCCWFSPLLWGFFSGYSGFPLSSKTNISKFQFDQESGRRRTTLWMCYPQIIIIIIT